MSSQAAQARDSWADTPIRRPRREPVSWASPEDLEILGGLGEERVADWTVLTLERDEDPAGHDARATQNVVSLERNRRSRIARSAVSVSPDAPTDEIVVDPSAPAADRTAAPALRASERVVSPTTRATAPAAPAPAGRRTVVIRGQASSTHSVVSADRRRPAPRTRDRVGHRPDRVAMWAVMLGLLLIVVATMTAG